MISFAKRLIRFRFCLILFTFIFNQALFSQQLTDHQIKLGYIYNFLRNITWQNESQIDTFKVGFYGENYEYAKTLKSIETYKVRNRPIKFQVFKSFENISFTHILVIDKSRNLLIPDIYIAIKNTNTLLVTDQCENKRNVMLNFILNPDSTITFEVNTLNIKNANLQTTSKLVFLGGSEIDVRNLYLETEKKLLSERDKSELFQKELVLKKEETQELNNKLSGLNQEIDNLKNEILIQKDDLKSLRKDNNDQQISLNEKSLILASQQLEIKKREEKLLKKEKEVKEIQQQIEENQMYLNTLKLEIEIRQNKINAQEVTLNTQKARIQSQRNFIFLSATLIFMALVVIILIYRNFNIRKKKNAELEKHYAIVKQHRDQIASQKTELEKHQNHLEHLVQERTIDLIAAKEKAEESDRLKTSFLANMSHEIRTPMNAIIGFLDLIVDEQTEPLLRKQYNEIIQSNSEVLLQLINDILDIAFIESGQLKVSYSEVNLNEQIEAAYWKYNSVIIPKRNKKIELKVNLPDYDIYITTDAIRFDQILSNLIDNALKYTDNGHVEVGYFLKDGEIVIYVKDTGIGIPTEKQNIIFERFAKIEDPKSKIYRGVGLGLAISKKLVELLGGKIWVESSSGKGSCFYFSQPISNRVLKKEIHEDKKTASELKLTYSDKVILICEDDDSNYLYLEKILLKQKFELHRAINGLEAVDFVLSGRHADLILMDLMMPKMDGIEATNKLKNEIGFKNPIIAQTAYATQFEKENYSQYFDAFLTKPIIKEELYASLQSFLK